jgi:ZIP family zinc transporter
VLARVEVALCLLFGAGVFVVSDRLVEVRFGDDEAQGGSPLGIVVGAIVDGVPESLVFGIQMAAGLAISPAFLGAVFISNVPQALAPSADLAQAGWSARKVTWMWGSVVFACGVAAGLGFLLSDAAGAQGGRAAGLAAGGVLAMLTNSLMPYAFDRAGAWAGIWTVVGFAASMAYT